MLLITLPEHGTVMGNQRKNHKGHHHSSSTLCLQAGPKTFSTSNSSAQERRKP